VSIESMEDGALRYMKVCQAAVAYVARCRHHTVVTRHPQAHLGTSLTRSDGATLMVLHLISCYYLLHLLPRVAYPFIGLNSLKTS
jgi:hypothetical protein